MKFIIAVDMEGCACACALNGCPRLSEAENLAQVKVQAVREVNAAAAALFEAGAREVLVWDNHGSGCNLNYGEIDERCLLAIGSTVYQRFPRLEGYTGVVMIGYHAMAGTQDACYAHTYSSGTIQRIKINGEAAGEIAIDAMIAGEAGVPVIFVSSDDKGVAEAGRFLPWAETMAVKQSLAPTRVISMHPAAAASAIREGVARAVKRLDEMSVLTTKTPVTVEIRYALPGAAAHARLIDKDGGRFGMPDGYTRAGVIGSMAELIGQVL